MVLAPPPRELPTHTRNPDGCFLLVCYFAWPPLLLDGLRELREESRSVRASPRSRSLSCYGYSPLIGRRLRRLVAWASLLHIRNRTHLQPLWVELLLRRRPLPLMNRRRRRRCRMLAKSGVPRAARATTLRCEPPSRLIRNRQLQPPRLRKCLRRRPSLPPTRRQSWTKTRRRSGRAGYRSARPRSRCGEQAITSLLSLICINQI